MALRHHIMHLEKKGQRPSLFKFYTFSTKSTFQRRLDSLFKKAHELSVLCGVEIVIIVNDPKESYSTLWPSREQVMNGVMKFMARSKEPGPKKMVLHDKFLSDKLKSMTDRLLKLQKKNDETEMGFLMTRLFEGGVFNELDVRQLNGLDQFVEEKLKKLENRYNELAGAQGQLLCTNNPHHIQMMTENRSGDFATTSITEKERWFGPGIENTFGMSRGINLGSTEVARSFADWNQSGVPDELGRAWAANFYP
ncbi:MADS-box transcription factor PHERES 2-like [Salvia splendens]|uniref:MADS-box transcription factor PHERES 2-like n=1 Tax=Salvia splendens TaxID=180675 RepID=UPI001C272830|nr:MADS-box transcription factor PHERES 2-like [Salvia splendens]